MPVQRWRAATAELVSDDRSRPRCALAGSGSGIAVEHLEQFPGDRQGFGFLIEGIDVPVGQSVAVDRDRLEAVDQALSSEGPAELLPSGVVFQDE